MRALTLRFLGLSDAHLAENNHLGGSTYDGNNGNIRTHYLSDIRSNDCGWRRGRHRHMAWDEGSREDGGFYGENGGRHVEDRENRQAR